VWAWTRAGGTYADPSCKEKFLDGARRGGRLQPRGNYCRTDRRGVCRNQPATARNMLLSLSHTALLRPRHARPPVAVRRTVVTAAARKPSGKKAASHGDNVRPDVSERVRRPHRGAGWVGEWRG
jgi:hypothetical protein